MKILLNVLSARVFCSFSLGCWHRTGSRGSYIEKERQRTKTKGSTQGDRLGAKDQVAIILGSVVVTVVVIIIRRTEKVQRATLCLLSPFHDLQRLTLMENEADERQFAQADKTVHYRKANPSPTPTWPNGRIKVNNYLHFSFKEQARYSVLLSYNRVCIQVRAVVWPKSRNKVDSD